MSRSAVVLPSLPYTLKTPFLTYAKVFIGTAILVALILGAAHNSVGMLLGLVVAGWTAFLLIFTNNWQTLSLQPDHLIFVSLGGKKRVLYSTIRTVDVNVETHAKGYSTLTLWLYHDGKGKSPIGINLRIFGAAQSQTLLGAILQLAPQAELNQEAIQVQMGQATFL